jgi:hypothetical protein
LTFVCCIQSTEFEIGREFVARIVGAHGAGVNKIRDSLGVKVDFSDDHDDKDKESGKKKKVPAGQKVKVKVSSLLCRAKNAPLKLWITDNRTQGKRRGGQASYHLTGGKIRTLRYSFVKQSSFDVMSFTGGRDH